MFSGAHVLFFSRDAEADRAFLRDSLGMPFVDAGHGWLIFQLPPAEAAVHPADAAGEGAKDGSMLPAELYLMCDDLEVTLEALRVRGVATAEVKEERWGRVTRLRLPSGGTLGLYQPKHATAYDL